MLNEDEMGRACGMKEKKKEKEKNTYRILVVSQKEIDN
jgi:hypothetical protein